MTLIAALTRQARAFRAYPTLVRVYFAVALEYRWQTLIWIFAGLLPLLMLAVWLVVAEQRSINGFDQTAFISYYLMVNVARRMTGIWIIFDMDRDIRQGQLSFALLKPIHPMHLYFTAAGLAPKVVSVTMVLIPTVIAALLLGAQYDLAPLTLLIFLLACLIGLLLEFFGQACVGAMAFWVTNVFALAELWYITRLLGSGWLVPLEMFPPSVTQLLHLLPYRYIIGFPIDVIMGRLSAEQTAFGLAVGVVWVAIMGIAFSLLWRAGLKRYGAVGA
jgi:ABC-2 type transport system permease protein